jgi:hypothetical protein
MRCPVVSVALDIEGRGLMRLTILRAEERRIKELRAEFDKDCPVCAASQRLRDRYDGYDGCAYVSTACHPKIQVRCRQIIEFNNKLEDLLIEVQEDIERLENK